MWNLLFYIAVFCLASANGHGAMTKPASRNANWPGGQNGHDWNAANDGRYSCVCDSGQTGSCQTIYPLNSFPQVSSPVILSMPMVNLELKSVVDKSS